MSGPQQYVGEPERSLIAVLAADGPLVAKLADGAGGFYVDLADENAKEPLVVLNEEASSDAYTFGGRQWTDTVVQVRALTRGDSAKVANEIASRIDDLLNDGEFAVAGEPVMYCRRVQRRKRSLRENGIRFSSRGGLYRVWLRS